MKLSSSKKEKKDKDFNLMCHTADSGKNVYSDIALVGNPNVGKSSLFNQITGIGAIVSNFPGTTCTILEGKTKLNNQELTIVDLPGAYSLSDISEDEKVTKEFIKNDHSKIIINVIDASILERNLYFTLQVLALQKPTIIALNFVDEAKKKGITIDKNELSYYLGVEVVEIDALRGKGVEELMKKANNLIMEKKSKNQIKPKLKSLSSKKINENAAFIASKSSKQKKTKEDFSQKLEMATTDPLIGSIIMILVFGACFFSLFMFGGYFSGVVDKYFTLFASPLKSYLAGLSNELLKTSLIFLIDGINAGLQIALPYILTFYIILGILEDSGYLPRIAYLLDRFMHKFKLHGKAIIPMLLGFGCSVPAILGTRILPSKKERIITSVLINLIPCSARTAVILGAAGAFIGWQYALLIYIIILLVILFVGFILSKMIPGESTGLILEMPPYRLPSIRNIFSNTWIRLKEFFVIAFPMIIIGSVVLGILVSLKVLPMLSKPFEGIFLGWLMIPTIAAIPLIYGILRKELALEMLLILGGSMVLTDFMTPLQVFTFSLVAALYFPCIATFAVLKHEFGWKTSFLIAIGTSTLAILISGIIARLLIYLKIF